jgi:ABC-type glycerol-3-phosphate transport system substrate-binding protein
MTTRRHTRRQFLKTAATGVSAAGLMATAGRARAASPTATPVPPPTPTPVTVGKGATTINMWVQDFGPVVDAFRSSAVAYSKTQPGVTINVQVIAYSDLKTKVIPAVAAGTEAEIMMGYNSWFVATHVDNLFLPLDKYLGGRAGMSQLVFPNALDSLATPHNTTYFVPWLAGVRGAVTTVNATQYKAKGIDYTKFQTWDDVIAAAKELTVWKNGKMTHCGLSLVNMGMTLIETFTWQYGGDFYNQSNGAWTFSTPEGMAAAQKLYDAFWTDKVCSWDFVDNSEYNDFTRGWISTEVDGAWTIGVQQDAIKNQQIDGFVTPLLAGAKRNWRYPDELAVLSLSRRLAQDSTKLNYAVGLVKLMLQPDNLLNITQTYTGLLMSKPLYSDPRINKTKYGPISKRLAEGVWPTSHFPRSHVADFTGAITELQRGLRKEISLKQALANMDAYCNQQEKVARQRLGLPTT